MKISLKKLNQAGFDHLLVGMVIVVAVAVVGTYYFVSSNAAAWTGALEVYSQNSGYCLTANGTQAAYVVLDACTGPGNKDQTWTVNDTKLISQDGVSFQQFTLKSGAGTNECLADLNNNSRQGVQVRLNTCGKGTAAAETWVWSVKFTSVGFSVHQMSNVETALCLDDLSGSDNSNTPVDLYTCKNNQSPKVSQSNQEWFENSSPKPPTPTAAKLVGATGSTMAFDLAGITEPNGLHYCLDNYQGSDAGNTKADVSPCNGLAPQTWVLMDPTVDSNSVPSVEITDHDNYDHKNDNMCLEVNKNLKTSGTDVGIYTCNGSAGQRWTPGNSTPNAATIPSPLEPFELTNPNSGMCLTDPNASKTGGTQFQIQGCNGSTSQSFQAVTPASSSSI